MKQEFSHALKVQRRRRRLTFWIGFLALLLVGSLWAGLTKDPFGAPFQDDFVRFGMEVGR